jgi:pimeloyl-ACP methyl ester carboxylesterase
LRKVYLSALALILLLSAVPSHGQFRGQLRQRQRQGQAQQQPREINVPNCDAEIPPLASGYGTGGSYTFEMQSVDNAGMDKPVLVFLPQGAAGKRPVIFFSHGYGPNYWEAYRDLIAHLVSRGSIVVYSTFPERGVSMQQRYDDLWAGFALAAKRFGDRMDLTRVGFLGHSFGGGATPAMARRGLEQGWGKEGAFVAELAPWYSYDSTTSQLQSLPAQVVQFSEVYDRDTTNDHRMAIDLFEKSRATERYFFLVHTREVGGCAAVSDHSTPGRHPSIRLKQYAVFRPLDALVDDVFSGSPAARSALAALGKTKPAASFEPLEQLSQPAPDQPESYYKWPWDNAMNPRAGR